MKSNFNNLRERLKNYLNNQEDNKLFNNCFFNTIDTTARFDDDGSVFVITGDIPAMWLRDSSAQVMQYLCFSDDMEVQALIKGVIKKQMSQIIHDPYANAFMHDNSTISEWKYMVTSDQMEDDIWERKFELDSLCYPFFLLCKYFDKTYDMTILDTNFYRAFDTVIETVNKERKHSEKSSYFFHFVRGNQVLDCGNNTNPEEEKGLVWSGFRPSDDKCKYHYHIPDNMFLVSVLYKLAKIFAIVDDNIRKNQCDTLINELKPLIETYGVINHPKYGPIYVSETNCLGEYETSDDANIPSLLSLPYLEYPFLNNTIYQNTRRMILSNDNKYYYEGSILKGIGSPHTPVNRVWPLSLAMQGITSNDKEEIINIYQMLKASTNNEGLMHEGVDINDPSKYSRPWFAWANSLFSYFVILKKDIINQ